MRRIEGVLCDLDGTLVNSEPFHLEAWNLLMQREGYDPKGEWNEAFIGIPDDLTVVKVKELFPKMQRHDDLLDMKQKKYRELIIEQGRKLAYPGVKEKLDELVTQGVKLAVGTNSGMENTVTALKAAGLDKYFAVLVTYDKVAQGKPSPEIYRTAAEFLGLEPGVCAVIEDSPTGIASGKAAGCLVFGVTNSWPEKNIPGADRYFPDTAGTLGWIIKNNS